MQMHAEQHKRMNGDYGSQDRLDFSDFWKLIKNMSLEHVTVSLEAKKKKKTQYRKTKYNSKVYNNMLLLRSAAGAPTNALKSFISTNGM